LFQDEIVLLLQLQFDHVMMMMKIFEIQQVCELLLIFDDEYDEHDEIDEHDDEIDFE
jgi:hypothetical protein